MNDSVHEHWAHRTKVIRVLQIVEAVALLVLVPLVYFLAESYAAVVLWPILLAGLATSASLKCPGCRKTIWDTRAKYCPSCGLQLRK